MRVVLDANIVISFMISRGETISAIFESWAKESFIFLTSREILIEIDEVIDRLIKRKIIDLQTAISIIRRLRKDTYKVKVTSNIDISKNNKDNRYLACALDGKADFLVTGDRKHLLSIKKIGKTKIISPKDFLEILKN